MSKTQTQVGTDDQERYTYVTLWSQDWKPVGEEADPDYPERGDAHSRLIKTLMVNQLCMHLEAWELRPGTDLQQPKQMSEDDFDRLHTGFGADGPFETLTIDGREYVVFASPYC